MTDLLSSGLIFLLLCGSAIIGSLVAARLPERHRTRETIDFTRLVTGLLVTFTALVTSLLITSVNSSFEKTEQDLRGYSSQLIRLTGCLENLGAETAPIRTSLRAYTASALASTWPEEAPPSGQYPKADSREDEFDAGNLGELLLHIQSQLQRVAVSSPEDSSIRASCLVRLDRVLDQRWILIDEAKSAITLPFYDMLAGWLVIVFFSFGLSAPRNELAAVFVFLVAVAVAGAFFVILELDGPLDGLVKVSSEPMRHALRHIDWSLATTPGKG
ncbi:hypothetical protein [Lichenihabitans psoromatis]|uniref:bestrophin-like domain n=1 Tax=Lichenihabitans psoromatis TaxID=2528642 RepID=UPI0010359BC8|nr:hypothetical protein [Lichenihabitans psoromatis]